MTAGARLGNAFRRLSSALKAEYVRGEDQTRSRRNARPVDGRAAQIEREALTVERRLQK